MYFAPVYVNGKNVNPDGNIYTTHCTCLECGSKFTIERQRDEVTVRLVSPPQEKKEIKPLDVNLNDAQKITGEKKFY